MHEETVSPTCLRLIDKLSEHYFIKTFYLVGGTALALHLGHRVSIDLDFFSGTEFDPSDWEQDIRAAGEISKLEHSKNSLSTVMNDVKTEFLYFAYPNQFPLIGWRGIMVLDPKDIAVFKLLAIIGRNRKKDIVDLYFIHKEVLPLSDVVKLFRERFAPGDVNLLDQYETLFNDSAISRSSMPKMLRPIDWDKAYEEVKLELHKAIPSSAQKA